MIPIHPRCHQRTLPINLDRVGGPRRAVCHLAIMAAALVMLPAMMGAEPVRVRTTRPTTGEITRYVALPGTLRANQQVTVQARVAGFVRSITVDRGDRVSAGQSLAEIEVPELLAEKVRQQAEVKVAEAEARRLEAARQRSPDLVTAQSLDAATGRLDMARADLEKTSTLLRYATLTAPFSGTVTARFVDPGAFVPAGGTAGTSAVVTLADTSILRVHVEVPEVEAARIRPGQPVRVSVEGPGQPIGGTISRHAGALDEATRTLPVEADLANPDGTLRPGMSATVRLGVERRAGTTLLRTDAILLEKASAHVFVVDGGLCRKTPVKLGIQDGPVTEITSGLTGTEAVIVPARSAPADRTPVRVEEAP
jgi:RND family efflux transporter MFP subunit